MFARQLTGYIINQHVLWLFSVLLFVLFCSFPDKNRNWNIGESLNTYRENVLRVSKFKLATTLQDQKEDTRVRNPYPFCRQIRAIFMGRDPTFLWWILILYSRIWNTYSMFLSRRTHVQQLSIKIKLKIFSILTVTFKLIFLKSFWVTLNF